MDIFFCQNCEKPMLDMDEYIMYEGLCKECYYRGVYQEGMTQEQIDWIQPNEKSECQCKRPMFTQFKQLQDVWLREKNKDFNER